MTPLYELRTYAIAEGMMARTLELYASYFQPKFNEHGVECIAAWVPQDAPESTLYVLVRHADPSRIEANFAAIIADWERDEADPSRDMTHGSGKGQRLFLTPTAFSTFQ